MKKTTKTPKTAKTEKVDNYIKGLLKKGIPPKLIKKELIQFKYPKKVADQLVEKNTDNFGTIKPDSNSNQFHFNKIILTIISLIIISILSLFFLSSSDNDDCTNNRQCFLDKANKCVHASYQNSIGETEFLFTTTEDCTLIKQINRLNENEPIEIKELFQDKYMSCNYQKNNFEEQYLDSISYNIDNCDGELKDIIIDTMVLLAEEDYYEN